MIQHHNTAFVGFGQSRIFRHDEVVLGQLAVEASRLAIKDAGLDLSEIDGIVCAPNPPFVQEGKSYDGVQFVTTELVARVLGLEPNWTQDVSGMIINSVVTAIGAIESGLCNHVLIFRALHSPSGSYGHTHEEKAVGAAQYVSPYGFFYPAGLAGQPWHQYQDKYGTGTREQMASYVIQERHNGLLYEGGYWHQYRPNELTRDEYLNARIVSSPASIYDCDIPIQGAGAFILTTAERAKDLPHPPAYVRGIGVTAAHLAESVAENPLENFMDAGRSIASHLWQNSGLTKNDIKVANLYDGFSMITMMWLEALGFCNEGEAFDFIQEGRTSLDGQLPINPSGGNLGSGRLHGVNHLMDAILQVMGRSGQRQIPNADIALAAIGAAGPNSGAIIIGQEPSS